MGKKEKKIKRGKDALIKNAPSFSMAFGQIGDITNFADTALMLSDTDGAVLDFWVEEPTD